jgi:hypothetical protein
MAVVGNGLHTQQPLTPPSPLISSAIFSAQDDVPPFPLNFPRQSEVLHAQKCEGAMTVTTVLHVIATQRAALANLEQIYQTDPQAQDSAHRAVAQVVKSIKCGGKLVVCGMGKSGKIGRKIEATMNSMGICSVFLHPSEALHGDLGMVRSVCVPCFLYEFLFLTPRQLDRYASPCDILRTDSRAVATSAPSAVNRADYRYHSSSASLHLPITSGSLSRDGYSLACAGPSG